MSYNILYIFLKFNLYATIGLNIKIDIHCIEFIIFGEIQSFDELREPL